MMVNDCWYGQLVEFASFQMAHWEKYLNHYDVEWKLLTVVISHSYVTVSQRVGEPSTSYWNILSSGEPRTCQELRSSFRRLDLQRLFDFAYLLTIIKGSWEAILPSYEWLLLDGIDYDEGWCASETWPWWRVVWAFALHDNTEWWRVVREWDLTLMKGGVSLCITWQYSRKELTLMKGGVRLYTIYTT